MEKETGIENVFVVTGGTSGMGLLVAMKLAKNSIRKKSTTKIKLILIGRDSKKGNTAITSIREYIGFENNNHTCDIIYIQADLSLMSEIMLVATRIRKLVSHVDILLHAAGNIFTMKRRLTSEGLELCFAIQYMARYALTEELLGLLNMAKRARVLSLMGGGATEGNIDFNNLQGEKRYGFVSTIKKMSIASDLLTCGQMKQHPGIAFFNYGPGLVKSGMLMKNPLLGAFVKALGCIIARDPEDAADDMMELLVLPEKSSCIYESGFYGLSVRQNLLKYSSDNPDVTKMWEYGEKILNSWKNRAKVIAK